MTHIPARFYGLWIALADDEATVLASGKTAEEAVKKARKNGHGTLIVAHVPKPEIPNDSLLASIAAAEEEERNGTLVYHSTANALLASLR